MRRPIEPVPRRQWEPYQFSPTMMLVWLAATLVTLAATLLLVWMVIENG